ncbi:hypothetical protein MWU59_04045 [Flavobacteriaceae bacterium F08102]|nr:hypothetical protein [Flavobacteriaceae bacterium F08102]
MVNIKINSFLLLLVIMLPRIEKGFQKGIEVNETSVFQHEDTSIKSVEECALLTKVITAATTDAMVHVNNHSEYGIKYSQRSLEKREMKILKKYLEGKVYDDQFGIHNENEYFEISTKTLVISYNNEIEYGPLLAYHVKDRYLKVLLMDGTNKVLYSAPFAPNTINFNEIRSTLSALYYQGIKREFKKFYKE